MLHIILFILKILGLAVLFLLGLLLVVTLLVLLVPVRYQAEGSYYGKVKGKVRVFWLLHILSVTVAYEKDVTLTVRLLGFRIFKPKKINEELRDAEDIMVQAMEVKGPEMAKEAAENVKEDGGRPRDREEESHRRSEAQKEENLRRLKDQEERNHSQSRAVNEFSPIQPQLPPPKENPFCRLISKLKKKLFEFFMRFKLLYRRIRDTLNTAKEKKEQIQAWVSDKKNQKTVKLLFRQVKKLIRHIFPRKGKGNVTFGFEDPYLTGQVLTYASVIYPFCHKHLNLYPVFDQAIFTAEGNFRGRIRIGTVLLIGTRMLLDRNFRTLLKRWL